jgi:FMN-dependent NADH-azoreductase
MSATLLHIDASPRRRSLSRAVADEFVAEWTGRAGPVLRRRLAEQPVPHITEAWTEICDNLMADQITQIDRLHEGVRTPAQRQAWDVLAPLLDEVLAADVVLISTPMHNYSVPSNLKAWLDQITFPRMDLRPRRFVVVVARGGEYGPGTPKERVEHQVTYLSDFLEGHFGVQRPAVIAVELTNSIVDPHLAARRADHERSLREARAHARDLAALMVQEMAVAR